MECTCGHTPHPFSGTETYSIFPSYPALTLCIYWNSSFAFYSSYRAHQLHFESWKLYCSAHSDRHDVFIFCPYSLNLVKFCQYTWLEFFILPLFCRICSHWCRISLSLHPRTCWLCDGGEWDEFICFWLLPEVLGSCNQFLRYYRFVYWNISSKADSC